VGRRPEPWDLVTAVERENILSAARDLVTTVQERGWAWLPTGLDIEVDKLARAIGPAIPPRLVGRRDYKIVRPYSSDEAPRNSMSARTGTGPQPMHTDSAYIPLPPRYVMLSCLSPGESECPTRLWSLDRKTPFINGRSPLTRPGWVVRGGGHLCPFYSQVLNRNWKGQWFIRFDPCCMVPPYANEDEVEAVRLELEAMSVFHEFTWFRGSILILDNWRCLHGRGDGAEHAPGRRLVRFLIGEEHGMGR